MRNAPRSLATSLGLLVSTALVASACQTDFSGYDPPPLLARNTFELYAVGDGTVHASACVAYSGLTCESNGEVTLSAGPIQQPLAIVPVGFLSEGGGSDGNYLGMVNEPAPGTPFVFTWRGPGEQTSKATVTMPAPFTIASPADPVAPDAITFTWEPHASGDPMTWRALVGCPGPIGPASETASVEDNQVLASDPGTFTIPSFEIGADNLQPGQSCTITLEVARQRTGTTDPTSTVPATLVAEQVREVTLTIRR